MGEKTSAKAKGNGKGGKLPGPAGMPGVEKRSLGSTIDANRTLPVAGDAKRQRGLNQGIRQRAKGNPHCTQQEDCIGNSITPLFQHMDGDVKGDIYCASCWDA